jgi:glycosyltransferase involved in cell wall biosynthesis
MHYVPNYYNPEGGRERFVCGLVRHLDEKFAIQQTIITNSNNKEADEIVHKNIKVFCLPSKTSGAYKILKGLVNVLQHNRCDIINIHGYGEYAADVVCILKKLGRLHVPLVLATYGIAGLKHGYLALNLSFALTPKERILRIRHLFYDFTLGRLEMSTFNRIIISSEEERLYLYRIGVKEKNLRNIPIAINEIFFASTSEQTRNNILYVGRIDRYKGIDILVRAIKQITLSNLPVRCIIVGKDVGYKSKLELSVKDLNLRDIVEIKDEVSQDELVNLYSSAIVTVLPSFSEGFPLSLVESMACGTPFLATPVGAIPELVNQTKAGITFPIGDSRALSKSISKLMQNRALWLELSTNAKNFAANFRWDRIGQRFYEIYLGLTSKS